MSNLFEVLNMLHTTNRKQQKKSPMNSENYELNNENEYKGTVTFRSDKIVFALIQSILHQLSPSLGFLPLFGALRGVPNLKKIECDLTPFPFNLPFTRNIT